jgi:predicted nucleic acid-binding protein
MVVQHRPLLYIETSVFGFCFDPEPRNAVRREGALALLEQIRLGVLDGGTSPVTFHEFEKAAEPLRSRLLVLLDDVRILPADDDEVERLAEVYLREGVMPAKSADDARHVAYATVCKADILVSLNLRHLANEWTERKVGAVNLREGYQVLRVRTPEEVLRYED